jgi:hypothetical protein
VHRTQRQTSPLRQRHSASRPEAGRRRATKTAPQEDRRRQPRERSSYPDGPPPPKPDRGLGLLIVFTGGVLVMVALISLIAVVGTWWMLIPVMTIDFAVTVAVLASIVRLLDHGSD